MLKSRIPVLAYGHVRVAQIRISGDQGGKLDMNSEKVLVLG